MNEFNLYNGDVMEWARCYEGAPFHAMTTDPPYHLNSIVKRFGSESAAEAQHGTDGVYQRSSRGFMGAQWDGGSLAFEPETWAALAEHLLPGAFIFAFCGSRGWHRQAVAMEDAGLIMNTSLFLWAFGSGFPKATRVKGDERFREHRYGGQAIKPACEPILLFQKPYKGRPLDNITQTGAGALNIGAGRIGSIVGGWSGRPSNGYARGMQSAAVPVGRWPSNLLLDSAGAERLDVQSGVSKSPPVGSMGGGSNKGQVYGDYAGQKHSNGFGDSGGASRFFHCSDDQAEGFEQERLWHDATADVLASADGLVYCAKAGRVERDAGLLGLPTVPGGVWDGRQSQSETRCIGSRPSPVANNHPCVKPISMLRHLCSLLLPPPEFGPRRILVPFAGSGSECIAASLAGFEFVQGIEQSPEYCEIARKRWAFWTANSGLFEELTRPEPEPELQADLFAQEVTP